MTEWGFGGLFSAFGLNERLLHFNLRTCGTVQNPASPRIAMTLIERRAGETRLGNQSMRAERLSGMFESTQQGSANAFPLPFRMHKERHDVITLDGRCRYDVSVLLGNQAMSFFAQMHYPVWTEVFDQWLQTVEGIVQGIRAFHRRPDKTRYG
jgi:hypothetical protein